MATSDPSQSENTYILGDSSAEMVRLIEQDRHFTRAMGGLLPEQTDLSSIHRVLDVGCGPGGWALELAQAYPQMQVVGIDISARMIDYANAQARASGLDNASFQAKNALDPLNFPEGSFDLVNARFIEGFIPTVAWPAILQEFVRITRPGGIIRLTDCEWGMTNSFAYQKLLGISIHAMQVAGLSHSPDGRNYAITPLLSRFLSEAGCVNIKERAHSMDFSAGTEAHLGSFQDFSIGFQLMQPFQVNTGVTTQQEVEQLHRQLTVEMLDSDFRGIMYFLTAWGEKPQAT